MKAYPPVTAEPSSHARPESARPSRFALTMRRVAIGAAGLAVAVLAAAACVLSFDDLRALAMQAGARANFAYLYPAAFDALLVAALISFMLLSTARPLVRLQAGFVLFVLLVAASWANVSMAMRFSIDARLGAVIVGVVPWMMLLIGLWLLTLLIKHAQVRRAAYEGVDGAGPRDIVPFDGADSPEGDTAEHPRPDFARPGSVPAVFEPLPSPTSATTPSPASTAPGSAEPSGSSGEHLGVDHEPPVPAPPTRPGPVTTSAPAPPPPTPASASAPPPGEEHPESPAGRMDPATPKEAGEGGRGQGERDPLGRDPVGRDPVGEDGHEEASRTQTAPAAAETVGSARTGSPAEPQDRRSVGGPGDASTASAAPADAPSRGQRDDVEGITATSPGQGRGRPKRPIQWGDLLRSPQGDVLVHPRPGQEPGAQTASARPEDAGQASEPAGEASRAEATDWEPEETEAGPPESDASSDEAEPQTEPQTVEGGVPVWPPDAIDTRPNVAMSPEESQPHTPAEGGGELLGQEETRREEFEAERDTQPYPHLRDQAEPLGSPDPAHGAGDADPEELADAHVPASGGPTVPLAPPSGRMRSTPVPPRE